MVNQSTHLLFDGEKIVISTDIRPVFEFLMEIEKEVNSIAGFNNKLEQIRKGYSELLQFCKFLGDKLVENSIDFKYELKNNFSHVIKNFETHFPVRSEMIILFASLEVLLFLNIAYEHETTDENELRLLAKDTKIVKAFLNKLILNDKNQYYLLNKSRFKKVNARQLRDLRNSLTHFFSVSAGGLSIAPSLMQEKTYKLEKIFIGNKHGNIVFMSPEDLRILIRGANILRMKKWSEDFQGDPVRFQRKMRHVVNLVQKHGAVIVYDKHLNI
jgi:hypothetical protein